MQPISPPPASAESAQEAASLLGPRLSGFHKIHRSREVAAVNRNYAGLLPVWDIMFGSYYMPKDLRPTEYGVHEAVPSGWWAQMKYPLKHS